MWGVSPFSNITEVAIMITVLKSEKEAYDIRQVKPPHGMTVNCIQYIYGSYLSVKQIPDKHTVAWYEIARVPQTVKESIYKEEQRKEQIGMLKFDMKLGKRWESNESRFNDCLSVIEMLEKELEKAEGEYVEKVFSLWQKEKAHLLSISGANENDLREYMLEACSCGAHENKNNQGVMLLKSVDCKLHKFTVKSGENV